MTTTAQRAAGVIKAFLLENYKNYDCMQDETRPENNSHHSGILTKFTKVFFCEIRLLTLNNSLYDLKKRGTRLGLQCQTPALSKV